jgi:DNA-binding CsgD family transcriptional regulator
MTGTAHTILGGDIVLSHTFLRGARRVADEALQALLTRVACGHTGSSLEMVAIAPSLGRPLIVQAVSLPAHVFGEAAMLVTVHQTETRSDQRIDALAIACELTAAERKLTRLLAGGCGLTRAAASLGVSVSTARTHLKAIFAKTNTHSQAELAALFAGV